jgi:gamma-glutamyltranspeptidase/glutathione hydrolase
MTTADAKAGQTGHGHTQAMGSRSMVTTAFPSASEAAIEILHAGGNAIDAAVAAAWALAVCEPSGSGLGGQTTLLIRFAEGRTLVVDGYSRAPAAVSRKQVNREQQQKGYRACTIPSTAATLGFAQKRYGVLDHSRTMEPAIRLAENGYEITKLQRKQLRWCQNEVVLFRSVMFFNRRNWLPLFAGWRISAWRTSIRAGLHVQLPKT